MRVMATRCEGWNIAVYEDAEVTDNRGAPNTEAPKTIVKYY
jgi:hypothetical protein